MKELNFVKGKLSACQEKLEKLGISFDEESTRTSRESVVESGMVVLLIKWKLIKLHTLYMILRDITIC